MKRLKKVLRPDRIIKLKRKEDDGNEEVIAVEIGLAKRAADGICGDAQDACRLSAGGRALILSDGMGKGIKAAAESRLVVRRLTRNLCSDMPVAAAIKEVNRYMVGRAQKTEGRTGKAGGESFATVDLTIVDCRRRKARFYKMGAAASFLVRDGRVRRIERGALPVGIVPRLKLSGISRDLKAGDMIIMVSDGITDSAREDLEGQWLEKLLKETDPKVSPQKTARTILKKAAANYGSREKDDMTVIAAVITGSGTLKK